MNRTAVALLAALEAVLAACIGLGVVLVPLTVLWAVHFGMAVPFGGFLAASADTWLLGHGVDLTVALGSETAAALGLPAGAAGPFTVTIAVLGIGGITAAVGFRAGRRAGAGGHWRVGAVSGAVVLVAAGLVAALLGRGESVHPSIVQAVLLPAAVFVGFSGLGAATVRLRRGVVWSPLRAIPPDVRIAAGAALRAGTAAAAALLAGAAVLLTVLLVLDFGRIVALYEGLQAGVLGSVLLTLAEFALLPNAVILSAAWLAGPGFAIGAGSSVSPWETQLGPLPGLPLLGVLPEAAPAFGLVALAVPIVAGFVAGLGVRGRLDPLPSPTALAALLGAAVVAGAQTGLLAWWASGAAGPGRLVDVGANPWSVTASVAGLVALGALTASGVRRRRARTPARGLRDG